MQRSGTSKGRVEYCRILLLFCLCRQQQLLIENSRLFNYSTGSLHEGLHILGKKNMTHVAKNTEVDF